MSWKLVTGDDSIRRFSLSDDFIKLYKDKPVPWGYGALSEFTYKRTYARRRSETNPELEGTEDWWETCRRVIEGMFTIQKKHCVANDLPWINSKAQRTAKDAYDRLFNLKWTPPGRGLWMMGTKYIEEVTGACLFNCAAVSTGTILIDDPADPFAWTMDALMLGVGVGFDTQGAGKINVLGPKNEEQALVIEDSRQGWVESLRALMNSYFLGHSRLVMDYSRIRKAGEPIKRFGGIAAGSDPLRKLHEEVSRVLQARIGSTLSSVDITDIMDMIGRCVVSGNVRRSALLSLGSSGDKDFLQMKDPNKFQNELVSWRWASNNSAAVNIGTDYSELGLQTSLNGEPGYVWLSNCKEYGRIADGKNFIDMRVVCPNPCAEQILEHKELCCLGECYPARHDDMDDLLKTLKVAYLYSKTVTLVNTHWKETNAVMLKNRRIGLSMTGVVQAINKFGMSKFVSMLDTGYKFLKDLDAVYSDWLCVPRSKKITTVKPSGTVSVLAGATPGVHFPHAKYYIRRVRVSSRDPLLNRIREAGYSCINDKYSPDTVVVEFPIEEQCFVRGKNDVSMWEQLELAALMQYIWADNAVSVTVTFRKDEAKDIKNALDLFQYRLKTVSFLPISDHGYELTPYEEISESQYKEMMSKVKSVNLSNVNDCHTTADQYCESDYCIVKNESESK